MAYSARTNIEDRYGVTNVSTWADLDADADATKITNRIARAIVVADAYINDRLRASSSMSFKVPYAKDDGTVPATLQEISVMLAGYWLSTARGVKDYDQDGKPLTRLYADYQLAIGLLEQIVTGHIHLEDAP